MFENKKNIILGVLGFLMVVIVATLAYAAFSGSGGAPVLSNGQTNTNTNSATVAISTPKGAVTVNNFTLNPLSKTESSMELADTNDYQIIYFQKEGSFLITLASQPATAARIKAETAFLSILNINKEQACKLTVALKIPYSVDENLAGPDYGLSFCPH